MSKMSALESIFYDMYPNGFDDDEMKSIEKKHKLDKFSKMSKEMFSEDAFKTQDIVDNFYKIVSRSTLVSRFEKPLFKTFIQSINDEEKECLTNALYEYINGDEKKGFTEMIAIMQPYKVAKWPILTVVNAYLNLEEDVFIKPTTVKLILKYFDSDLHYTSKPNYEFYRDYRNFFNAIKLEASSEIQCNNPAFLGFLMMTIGK